MNDCLKSNFLLIYVKNAEITPCFKKWDKVEKENYWPVSIYSSISVAFKKDNTQYVLLRMIENWRTQLNKKQNWCDYYGPL